MARHAHNITFQSKYRMHVLAEQPGDVRMVTVRENGAEHQERVTTPAKLIDFGEDLSGATFNANDPEDRKVIEALRREIASGSEAAQLANLHEVNGVGVRPTPNWDDQKVAKLREYVLDGTINGDAANAYEYESSKTTPRQDVLDMLSAILDGSDDGEDHEPEEDSTSLTSQV